MDIRSKTNRNKVRLGTYQQTFPPRFKKPSLTELIFETIEKAADNKLFDVFFSGYAQSYRMTRYYIRNPSAPRFKTQEQRNAEHNQKLRDTFYSQLSYLKKKGFVEKQKGGVSPSWIITKLGKKKLAVLKNKTGVFAKRDYQTTQESKTKIILFDIPEQNRSKRDWLRIQLVSLGYTMLQKNIWIFKNKLPEEFWNDLDAINLLPHIHIFHVSEENKGTLPK